MIKNDNILLNKFTKFVEGFGDCYKIEVYDGYNVILARSVCITDNLITYYFTLLKDGTIHYSISSEDLDNYVVTKLY